MKFKALYFLTLIAFAIPIASCGGDSPGFDEGATDTDADIDSDSDADTDADSDSDSDSDADSDTDSDTDGDTDSCSDDFPSEESWGSSWQQNQGGDPWVVTWHGELNPFDDPPSYSIEWEFELEIWESYGAPMTPDSDVLSGDNDDYQTCWYCVLLRHNVIYDGDWQISDIDETLMANAGEIEITAIDPPDSVSGVMHDVFLREVTFGDDWQTDDVPDGLEVCFDEVVFEATW